MLIVFEKIKKFETKRRENGGIRIEQKNYRNFRIQ